MRNNFNTRKISDNLTSNPIDSHEHEPAGVTDAEWAALPVTFDARTMARLIGSNLRYVQNHAAELGGRKLGGRWIFSKPNTAELLGL